MKLKSTLIIREIGGVQFLVPTDEEAFCGVVRSNETAAFIVKLLQNETTKEALVDALCRTYDVARAEAAADTEEILNALRSLHVLEE